MIEISKIALVDVADYRYHRRQWELSTLGEQQALTAARELTAEFMGAAVLSSTARVAIGTASIIAKVLHGGADGVSVSSHSLDRKSDRPRFPDDADIASYLQHVMSQHMPGVNYSGHVVTVTDAFLIADVMGMDHHDVNPGSVHYYGAAVQGNITNN